MYSTTLINPDLESIVIFPFSKNVILDPNLELIYQNYELANSFNNLRLNQSLPPVKHSFIDPNLPPTKLTSLDISENIAKFKCICVGGTFDHIHSGHRILLSTAVLSLYPSGLLYIGLAEEPLLKNKAYKELITSYPERESQVQELINILNPKLNTQIIPLYDPYGPTISDPKVDCIVVSDETKGVVEDINQRRRSKGYNDLTQISIELLQSNNSKQKLSSSTIREQQKTKQTKSE